MAERALILVIAHGALAEALVATADMILGGLSDVIPIGLMSGDRPEDLIGRINNELTQRGEHRPSLLLLDLFGGSPSTAASSLLRNHPDLEVVTGVSLPMLLEVVLQRDRRGARSLATVASHSGRKGIVKVRDRLRAQGL